MSEDGRMTASQCALKYHGKSETVRLENDLINAAMLDPVLYACARAYGFSSREGLIKTLLEMEKALRESKEKTVAIMRTSARPYIPQQ